MKGDLQNLLSSSPTSIYYFALHRNHPLRWHLRINVARMLASSDRITGNVRWALLWNLEFRRENTNWKATGDNVGFAEEQLRYLCRHSFHEKLDLHWEIRNQELTVLHLFGTEIILGRLRAILSNFDLAGAPAVARTASETISGSPVLRVGGYYQNYTAKALAPSSASSPLQRNLSNGSYDEANRKHRLL